MSAFVGRSMSTWHSHHEKRTTVCSERSARLLLMFRSNWKIKDFALNSQHDLSPTGVAWDAEFGHSYSDQALEGSVTRAGGRERLAFRYGQLPGRPFPNYGVATHADSHVSFT